MYSTTVKAYGKINLNLKITGLKDGYHMLDSVVTTVNKCDVITVTKRKDHKILITFSGKYAITPKFQEQTNAYKAAKLLIDEYSLKGVNVEVVRNIPSASGMGGSSADIVGVLVAIKKLFRLKCKLKPYADMLGSDSGYLLTGGYARLTSRGEQVKIIKSNLKLYFAVIYARQGVDTKECFDLYDETFSLNNFTNTAESVEKALISENFEELEKGLSNDLALPAMRLNSEIEENLNILKGLGANGVSMTGSGPTVFAIYKDLEMAKWAVDKINKTTDKTAELLTSYDISCPPMIDNLFSSVAYEKIDDEEI